MERTLIEADEAFGSPSPDEETLRDETADKEDRQWAAEKLAPFLYPRPAPQPRAVRVDLPATDTAEGVTQAFAPSSPPLEPESLPRPRRRACPP